MNRLVLPALLAATLLVAPLAHAAELDVKPADTVESILAAQKGKRVTIRTRSGMEVTGVVKTVTGRLVQVAQIAGKEFFDAVVPLEAVDAVVIRTKD